MDERDQALEGFGITVSDVGSGTATAQMLVAPHMANRHGVCHGGLLFLLADAAMDYATNDAAGDDQVALAAHAEADFVKAANVGDTLTAVGTIAHSWGRSNLFDAVVSDQDGNTVVHFRGRTRTINKR